MDRWSVACIRRWCSLKLLKICKGLGLLVNSPQVFYESRRSLLRLFRYTKGFQTLIPNFSLHFLNYKIPRSYKTLMSLWNLVVKKEPEGLLVDVSSTKIIEVSSVW